MNLEWAMYELTKNPQAVICSDGQCRPALRYSRGLDRAIRWLVDRYTDGTLKVEGYVPKHNEEQADTAHQSKLLPADSW